MAKGWASTRSISWKSPWWSPSSTACSCAPTARTTSASSPRSATWPNTSTHTGRSNQLATLPLIAHASADAVLAYRAGKPILARQFLADVARAGAALGSGGNVLNVCADRYRFAVGLAASLAGGKVTLLPSTRTPEVIAQLRRFAPDAVCLTDEDDCDVELPQVRFPEV